MALREPTPLIAVVAACLPCLQPAEAGVHRMGAEPLVAWHAHPYQWVTDQDIHLGPRANLLLLRMAQNEWEHTAFALTNNTEAPQSVRVEMSCDGVPPDALEVRRVVMFEGAREGVFWLAVAANESWPKPELLQPVQGALTVPGKSTVHLWITAASRNLRSGEHRGWVRILKSQDNSEVLRVPLRIEVWPIRLPDKTGLLFHCWQYLPGPPPLADRVARLLAEHHATLAHFEIPPVKDGGLDLALDDWLERMKIARRWNLAPVFEAQAVAGNNPDPAKRQAVSRIGPIVRELGFKDWYLYVSDENHWGKLGPVMDSCEWLRESAPDAKLFHAFWFALEGDQYRQGLPRLADYSDVWCMFRNYNLADIFHGTRWKNWPNDLFDLLAREQKQGRKVMYYHNTWRSANYAGAALAWSRSEGWYCWLNGFDGLGTYYTDAATHLDPAPGRREGKLKVLQLPTGQQSISIPYYVRRMEDGRCAVLSCKRLEAFRDGLGDYMYLCMLDDLIHQAESSKKPELAPLARRARAVIDDTIEELRLYVHEYHAYRNAKRRLALEIMQLMKAGLSPRLNPDGTVVRHRWLAPEKIYPPEEGGIPHPLSG